MLCFKVKKTHYFPNCTLLLLLYAPPFWNTSIFTKLIVLRSEACSDWPAISALWLAEFLKRVTEMLRPLPYSDAVSRCDETKIIKPITNEAFVASSGDIFTDYKDLYCLFTRGVNRQWFHDSIRLRLSCQRFDSIQYHNASLLYQIYFVHFS